MATKKTAKKAPAKKAVRAKEDANSPGAGCPTGGAEAPYSPQGQSRLAHGLQVRSQQHGEESAGRILHDAQGAVRLVRTGRGVSHARCRSASGGTAHVPGSLGGAAAVGADGAGQFCGACYGARRTSQERHAVCGQRGRGHMA